MQTPDMSEIIYILPPPGRGKQTITAENISGELAKLLVYTPKMRDNETIFFAVVSRLLVG